MKNKNSADDSWRWTAKGMRSGTDNVPGIAGLGVAAKKIYEDFDEKLNS